ncbi:class I SAM-dependent DNA methyltransferase [Streptomyces evansiae]|uniref:class I SAM-dependent DNA methyltransferase n=1 Tax=Streptomyces evansiae TaxID=3075535 RepID=UPI0028887A56|nr:methyltransferase domain-containing protein [Streptomyces sp. DSM 41859]MDT0420753.1 methyltransferase domain-containing protein [Streptomyces sp. DSM 41859]
MIMSVPHDYGMEAEVWDAYAASAFDGAAEARFRWTQYEGHGPGTEVLGESPRRTLELGCGTGRAVGYLAGLGVEAHGLDLSGVMVAKVRERWPRGRFYQGEVLGFLGSHEETYDAVYSVFGCAWFADPRLLFPLVRARLRDGGVFAFSQPPAIPGAYGAQGMYKGGFAGRPLYTYRYSYPPDTWAELLRAAGFGEVSVQIVDAPVAGHWGTLLATAVR